MSRVRRPVYMDPAEIDRRTGVSYTRPASQTPDRTITIPSVEDFSAALQGRDLGSLGAPPAKRTFSPEEDVNWANTLLRLGQTTDYYDQKRAEDAAEAAAEAAAAAGAAADAERERERQQLIDAAFANLPAADVYTGEADLAALADYYAAGRARLENVYGGATDRIGATTAETLAALAELDPQAAFTYDVGAPNIPGVNVDYLRALGASADPVSAEAEFARNLLGYQLAASQQAAAGMAASLERERQARRAASQLMQQEGLRQAAAARAQALAQIAAQQAAEEALIREREREAQQREQARQQELAQLKLEFQLAGLD